MSMAAELEAKCRWYGVRDAVKYQCGQMTKDQLAKEINEAMKVHNYPYLEALEEQGVGWIIWRWNNKV